MPENLSLPNQKFNTFQRNLKKQLEEESATESKVGKPKQKKEPKPLLDRLK